MKQEQLTMALAEIAELARVRAVPPDGPVNWTRCEGCVSVLRVAESVLVTPSPRAEAMQRVVEAAREEWLRQEPDPSGWILLKAKHLNEMRDALTAYDAALGDKKE